MRRADWWAGGVISPESVTALSLLGFVCEHFGIGLALCKPARFRRDIIDEPVREETLGRIGIFSYEDETSGLSGNSAPRYRRRFTCALTGIYIREGRTGSQRIHAEGQCPW